jgi:hypothetical protein
MTFSRGTNPTIGIKPQLHLVHKNPWSWKVGNLQERLMQVEHRPREWNAPDAQCWVMEDTQLFKNSQGILTDLRYSVEKALGCLKLLDIRIPNAQDVRDYLFKFDDMIDLAKEVCRKARAKFGNNANLTLLLYHDPEIDDQYLTLYLRLDSYQANTMDLIDSFSRTFDDALKNKSGWLVITTDFQHPR